MKPPPDSPEFSRFTEALKDMLKVSKTQTNARIAAQKRSKPSASPAAVSSSK